MSNQMEIQMSVEEIFKCLEITFDKKSSGEDISNASRRLIEMDSQILNLLKLILEGISKNDINFSENIKLSALIYLKNSITGRIKSKKFSEDEIWQILHLFIEFLISSEISDKIISNTNNLIQIILSSKMIQRSFNKVVDLYKTMEKYLLGIIESNPNNDLNFKVGIFKRLTSFFQMIISTKSINENNLDECFKINLVLIDMILGKNLALINEIIKLNPSAETICPYFEINRNILDLLFLIIIKIKEHPNSQQNLEFLVSKYALMAQNLIIEEIVPNKLIMIHITENEELDKVMNTIKAKSFQFLSALIQYGSNTIKNEILQRICVQLIDYIIKNLDNLNLNKLNIFDKYDKCLDILFYHIFLFLSRCLNREPILTNFFPYIKKFIVFTLLPFIIPSEKEMILMKTEGEEYQSFILDLIGDHKSKSARTSVDFLIVRLCDKYDGLQFFLSSFCLQILDFAMNINNEINENTIIPEELNLLKDPNFNFQETLKNFNQETLIDVALILLCSIKPYLSKNKPLLKKLKFIFDSNIDKLHRVGSSLIKFDICLIYDLFIPSFMQISIEEKEISQVRENQMFMNRLDFLFMNMMNYEKNPGTSSQAGKAIVTIFNETNPDELDSNYMSQAFTKLIPHIEIIDLNIFFEVISDILSHCKIEQSLISAIDHSTKRILKEIKSNNPSNEKTSPLYISKCIQIITTILKENKLVSDYTASDDIVLEITENSRINLNEVEKCIEPLLCYLKNPNKIEFEDELLDILKAILNNSNTITPLSKEIFPYLSQIITKSEGMNTSMFKILNLYITKDDGFILGNENNLSSLISMLLISIDCEEEIEFSPVCASILLQILPNNKRQINISESEINKIIEKMIFNLNELNSTYLNQFNHMNGTLDMHLFTSFLTTIYSYFINYPKLTFFILIQKQFFETLISLTDYVNYFTYFSTHQSKIIILGLCSLLSNEEILIEIQNSYTKIISQLFSLLFKQKSEESKKMKQILSKEFECNFVDSDDEEEGNEQDDDDDYTPSQMIEYKKMMKTLKNTKGNLYNELSFFDISKKFNSYVSTVKNPASDFDEYEIFSNLIWKLRKSFTGIHDNWEKSLEGDYKIYWEELMKTRRIQISYDENISFNVPRRIVKVRRSNENN